MIWRAPPTYTAVLSPRVRGNLCGVCLHNGNFRSIPACAGEPLPAIDPRGVNEVYPRVCGGTHAPLLLFPCL